MINNRKKLYLFIAIGVIILALIIWGATILFGTIMTQKEVTLEPSTGTVITLGTQDRDNLAIANEIVITKTKTSKNLSPGNYVVVFSGTGYITQSNTVTIDNNNITIKTPALNYTNERLSEILNTEKSAIHQVVFGAVSENDYTISNEGLYAQANWYAADITPKNPTLDDNKIILRKDGSTWRVAAKPAIVFWIDNYPNIPQDVIRAANKLGFN